MKLKPPKNLENLYEDTQKVFNVLNHESDIACVLIGASYLSELLGSAIRTVLRKSKVTEKLLGPGKGILGSFQTRADMAYCLKIIGKSDLQDLEIIGNIRNSFAHKHLSFDFTDSEVAKECNKLNDWNIKLDTEEISSDPDIEKLPEMKFEVDSTRQRFVVSIVMIKQRIINGAITKMASE